MYQMIIDLCIAVIAFQIIGCAKTKTKKQENKKIKEDCYLTKKDIDDFLSGRGSRRENNLEVGGFAFHDILEDVSDRRRALEKREGALVGVENKKNIKNSKCNYNKKSKIKSLKFHKNIIIVFLLNVL